MRRLCVVISLIPTLAGCDSNGPTRPTEVTLLSVTGQTRISALNQTWTLTATARRGQRSPSDVTAEVTWQSSDPVVATVSAGGVIRSVGFGTATITAFYQGVRSALDIHVVLGPGRYRLSIIVSTACTSFPFWAQRQEFNTSIDDQGTRLIVEFEGRPGTSFPARITLTGAVFEFPPPHFDAYGDPSGPVLGRSFDGTSFFWVIGTASARPHGAAVAGQLAGTIAASRQGTGTACERSDHQFTLVPQ